ncbi:hypothetical protein NSERUTF1_1092 [Nocardia seriolae]|nr:hypothetical protein NSERUTF1_1092 [Nocardia seriolae]
MMDIPGGTTPRDAAASRCNGAHRGTTSYPGCSGGNVAMPGGSSNLTQQLISCRPG